MKLGIDFGTTRTLVAVADRGNYPVVSFKDEEGETLEYFPSIVAVEGGQVHYGLDALAASRRGAPALRSFKRLLAASSVTAQHPVRIGEVELTLGDLLAGYLASLRSALEKRCNLTRRKNDRTWECVVAVPAHAHAAQRFLTLDAFRRAGFDVRAVLNEPSAAGFEYSHRQGRTLSQRRSRVLVYDLGGGTFDASLVQVTGDHHDVIATAGDNRLGGDDFDEALARLVLASAGMAEADLDPTRFARLLDDCRDAKERITPNSRRVVVDGELSAVIAVDAYYEAIAPLVQRSVDCLTALLARESDLPAATTEGMEGLAGIYLVGGGSGLPLVARTLKQVFGRRVHRSPYPAASAAIGLAIAADETGGFSLTDRFSRAFGVFREREGGARLAFDPILTPDETLPKSGEKVISRRYRAAHNLGHFRFVECRTLDTAGEPQGDLLPFGEIYFAFSADLRARADLRGVPVERRAEGPWIEERYRIDANGLVSFEIEDLDAGYRQIHELGAS